MALLGLEACISDLRSGEFAWRRRYRKRKEGVRVTFPPKMGTIPPQIMYFLCIVTCFDVSAMYLKCISSVVFGAFGRLVSLCIVYVSSVHSHVSFLCLVPSFMLLY